MVPDVEPPVAKKEPTQIVKDAIEVHEANKEEHTDEELHLPPTPLN